MNIHSLFQICQPPYSYKVAETLAGELKNQWHFFVEDKNFYLAPAYLTSIEKHVENMNFRYVTVFDNDQIVMVLYFQIISLSEGNLIQQIPSKKTGIKNQINKLLQLEKAQMLVCGNLFSTGENGYLYDPALSHFQAMNLLYRIQKDLSKQLGINHFSCFVVKEMNPQNEELVPLADLGYFPLNAECNMVLTLQNEWKNSADYYQAMTSKFRTKANSIFSKSQALERREIDSSELENLIIPIYKLYNNVISNASYFTAKLSSQAIIEIKKQNPNNCLVFCYWHQNTLVGFSISFIHNYQLDVAYVGLDYEYNQDLAIYHRILHDMVSIGIKYQVKEIHMGRTASQFKSTLGAKPVDMKVMVRHKKKLTNQLLKPMIEKIKPEKPSIRNPFKSVEAELQ